MEGFTLSWKHYQNLQMYIECISQHQELCLSGQRKLSCTIHPLNLRTMSWRSSSSNESNYGWGSLNVKRWVELAVRCISWMKYARNTCVDVSLHFLSLVVQAWGKIRRHGHFALQVIPGVPLLYFVLFPLSLPILLIFIPQFTILSSLSEVWGSVNVRVWVRYPGPLGPPHALFGHAARLLWSGQSGYWGRLQPRDETGRRSGQKKDETEQ